MAKIALTGSRGFVGSHLGAYLNTRGHSVTEIGKDLLRSTELENSLRGTEILIHLAARAHVLKDEATDPLASFRSANVELTQIVARAAARAAVRRFIFLSSAGVLGRRSPPGGFTDQTPVAPHNPYTRSKLEAEEWLVGSPEAPRELVILRPPLIYGPGARGNFDRLLRAVRSGWPLPISGLDVPRSMLGVRNLNDLIGLAATHPGAPGAVMLVADRETTSVAEFARAISRRLGRRPRMIRLPSWMLNAALRMLGKNEDILRLSEPFELRPTVASARLSWSPPYSQSEELQWTLTFAGSRLPAV